MRRELPILFNTEMVRAILDGRKSCTRRIIKPQPQSRLCYTFAGGNCGTWGYPSKTAHESWGDEYRLPDGITDEELQRRWKPPYRADDILYVRETWSPVFVRPRRYLYKVECKEAENLPIKWHPSIHMPKEAARIWLKVTNVRVERLQEITEVQAQAEGCNSGLLTGACTARGQFEDLWNSTVKKSDIDRYGWDANSYVWVIEFERCEKPEGISG
jgi:hypothetical protein